MLGLIISVTYDESKPVICDEVNSEAVKIQTPGGKGCQPLVLLPVSCWKHRHRDRRKNRGTAPLSDTDTVTFLGISYGIDLFRV